MRDDIALLHAEARHEAGDALGAEEAHEVVLERDVEAGGAGVTLAGAAAAQLAVDAPRVVALGADDVEAAGLLLQKLPQRLRLALRLVVEPDLRVDEILVHPVGEDAGAELDVGAAAGHVGGDGDGAGLAGEGDDLGLAQILHKTEKHIDLF